MVENGNISRRTFLELSTSVVGGLMFIDGAQRFVGKVGIVDAVIPPTKTSQDMRDESIVNSEGRQVMGFIESWFGSNALKISSGEVLYRFIDR